MPGVMRYLVPTQPLCRTILRSTIPGIWISSSIKTGSDNCQTEKEGLNMPCPRFGLPQGLENVLEQIPGAAYEYHQSLIEIDLGLHLDA